MGPTQRTMTSNQPRSRRLFIAGMAASIGGIMHGGSLLAQPKLQNTQNVPAKPENIHRTTLHQEINVNATPHRIYDIFLDSKNFTALTGAPATIDPKAGGEFSLFGGLVVGRNVELIPDQLVVQAWRPTHWSPGVYSIAKFAFKPQDATTLITFDHTGFPEGEFDHLEWGWNNHYWEPLKKFVA
jgi:activator of HSP90 ATPase